MLCDSLHLWCESKTKLGCHGWIAQFHRTIDPKSLRLNIFSTNLCPKSHTYYNLALFPYDIKQLPRNGYYGYVTYAITCHIITMISCCSSLMDKSKTQHHHLHLFVAIFMVCIYAWWKPLPELSEHFIATLSVFSEQMIQGKELTLFFFFLH
jgi:hypothetical protein